MAYKRKVLSIDGGGIRGIIPAKLLAEIEKRTGKPICQLFDLIAGTSTGGILAAGLTKPDPNQPTQPYFRAEELIDVYRKEGETIFSESFLGNLFTLEDFKSAKYSSKGREKVLTQRLGDTLLKEALTDIFITSYDIELRTPIFFISDVKHQQLGDNFRKLCEGYTMKQATMATSAAPTYFKPYKIETIDQTDNGYYALVDGGVFANNPTALAVMEAIIGAKKQQQVLGLDDILVVSLGTGSLVRKYNYDKAVNWGLLDWALPVLNIAFDGGSESVACQLEQLLPKAEDTPKQYYRFQAQLSDANDDMDDASPKNIQQLERLADLIIQQRDSELDDLCAQLCE